jgi:hypothetical protein
MWLIKHYPIKTYRGMNANPTQCSLMHRITVSDHIHGPGIHKRKKNVDPEGREKIFVPAADQILVIHSAA